MVKKIIETIPIDNYEAAKILKEKVAVQDNQSSPIVARTEEYLSQITTRCEYEKSREILKELIETGISRETAIMLLNILPTEEAEIRALLPSEIQSLPLENVKKIAEILSKCYTQ